MPIRINLLAEEQDAEEMRRRDPVKRALLAGAAMTVLMLVWIGITQINVSASRRELAEYEARLQRVDDSSKQVRNNQMAAANIQNRLEGIERYSTNRFLWGTFLDAVQNITLENVRLVEIKTEQRYGGGENDKLFSTNLTVALNGGSSWWKFWARSSKQASVSDLVEPVLASITNKPPFTTNDLAYTYKVTTVSTNSDKSQAVVQVDFINPPWAVEKTIVEIRGRDYGTPPGGAIDEFARRINTSTYFKDLLVPVEGFRFTERPPQARPDPQDPINPNSMFVPFTIALSLKERIFSND